MTVTQAAEKYGYSRRTLLDAIERGALPALRMGHSYLVEDADVAAYHTRTGHSVGRPRLRPEKPKRPRGRPRKQPTDTPEGEVIS